LEALRSAMAGGETGRTRAASGGVLEDAACSASLRSPSRNLRVARNKRSGRHHGDDDKNERSGEQRSL
jgi:hypothetical protein